MVEIDVVVVTYNSAETLRECVQPLAAEEDINVIVVDSASRDGTLETVADLPITTLALDANLGFAYGCNRGSVLGSGDAVMFLNPDARITPDSIRRLAAILDGDATIGLVAPRITNERGSVEYSLRRFPRLRSTYSQALFLHRVFRPGAWGGEIVQNPRAYETSHRPEWVSGACVLVRRTALSQVGGWDEGFFFYGEDIDLCRRLADTGWQIRFEPSADAIHIGGGGMSAPRAQMLATLAASRIRYARLHYSAAGALLERVGIALGDLTHAAFSAKGPEFRAGHLRAFRVACSHNADAASRSTRHNPVPTTVELDRAAD